MTLYGPDLSSWQAGVDAAKIPADFIILKATGGTSYVNPECDTQFQSAKGAGRPRGVYHFAHEAGCAGSAADEAAHFVQAIQGYLDGETILILDWESDNVRDVAWALAWLDAVYAATGIRPLIYMSQNALAYGWDAVVAAGYGLWLAQYPFPNVTAGYQVPAGPPSVAPWPFAAMWQFTSGGRLDGYNGALDLNVFYGDRAAWLAYAAKSGSAPAPAPAPAPVVAPAPAPAPAAAPSQCIVEAGDTLGGIAAQFGVSLAAIEAANPTINPDLIYPGQVLNLPGVSAPAPAQAPAGRPSQCIVEAGDTLGGIAAQFGVSLAAIEAANPTINPDLIYPGQVLNL